MNLFTRTTLKKVVFFCFAVGLAGHLPACTHCTPQNKNSVSFDDMRLRYRATLIPAEIDRTDTFLMSRIRQHDSMVEVFWTTMNRAPDREYIWYEAHEHTLARESQDITIELGRLCEMARAYYTPASAFEGNDTLKNEVISALDWVFANRYNPSIEMYHNWWEWVIGAPMIINNTITILYDDLTEQQLQTYFEAMDHYAPNVTFEGASTGANKVWQCGNMALRGILSKRPEQIRMAIDGLSTEFVYVTSKDGFYRDGSFVQHQWHPYNGGYGKSMLSHLSDVVPLVHGSEWELPKPHQDMLFEWIRNGYEPLLYRGAVMDMVRGREIARKGPGDRAYGHSILLSMLKISDIAPAIEKSRMLSVIKAHILEDTYRNILLDAPTALVPKVRELLDNTLVQPVPPGTDNKIFSAMDRAIFKRPTFGIGLAMSSARIENYETINGENLKGWYTGDGMLYLYDNDLRQFGDNFWPTVNAYRMPGTTVDTRPRSAESLPFGEGLLYADGYKSPKHWVGGSSIKDQFSMIGMWYKADETTLEAKKSWFMAADEIVCLGAGIHSTDNRTIETILENRKLNEDKRYEIQVNGNTVLSGNGQVRTSGTSWVHFRGLDEDTKVGYFLPEKSGLNLLRETRTGSWYQINQPYGDKTLIEKDYFTMWIDHGRSPQEAGYAYVLLPGKTVDETAAFADSPAIEILANTPQVQAVRHSTEKVVGINFWEAGSVLAVGVKSDAPASVILHETDDQLVIGVSDPTQLNRKTIMVEIERPAGDVQLADDNITIMSTQPTVKLLVNVGVTLGQTQTITLKNK